MRENTFLYEYKLSFIGKTVSTCRHLSAKATSSFSPIIEENYNMYMCYILSFNGHVGSFHFLATVNSKGRNMGMQILLSQNMQSLDCKLRVSITDNVVVLFLGLFKIFQIDFNSLHKFMSLQIMYNVSSYQSFSPTSDFIFFLSSFQSLFPYSHFTLLFHKNIFKLLF